MHKKTSRANKGQFFVIAALLVSVVLVGGVISTYSWVRHPSISESPDVLGAIGEMNADIKSVLDFTVGYYGSILQVTGNATYAEGLTTTYLSSGLVNIARSHPDWNPSFSLNSKDVSTKWFMPKSRSSGQISVSYSLGALGIEGVTYETSSALSAQMLTAEAGQARINVTRDNSEPELGLTTTNFWFYNYSYADSTWELVNPSSIIISSNGVYNITLPNGVGPDSYSVQIEDNRGIVVSAFYSAASIASASGIPHYTYDFNWDSAGVESIYAALDDDTFVIELLQNGTLNWLGQHLDITNGAHAIPPVSVKAFRVNATLAGTGENKQIPFQVEDWASDYMVPLGLSGNESLFTNENMLVFLVNDNVDKITLWWDGNDTAVPSSYAHQNNINGDVSDTYDITLSNDKIAVNFDIDSSNLQVTATDGSTSNFVEFLEINGHAPVYHAGTSIVIHNGSVRAILQQEPEYSDGATNMYSQLILTLPVNTTYYTYTTRLVFVDSNPSLHRSITDLTVAKLTSEWMEELESFTEDGTSGVYPVVSETTPGSTDLFDNSPSSGGWEHHWSEYLAGSVGGGLMVTDSSNTGLYVFDSIIGDYTGALRVNTESLPIWTTPTSVSYKSGESGTNYATRSIDDRTDYDWSYWRHDSSADHWITYDMGESVSINQVRIYQRSDDWGGTGDVTVYVSDDPVSWGSPVWSGRMDGYEWEETGSFSAEGRYVTLYSESKSSSERLYEVDVGLQRTREIVEFNPVDLDFVTDFNDELDIAWYGAVAIFEDDPIYPDSGSNGLWVMVEQPPTVTMD